MNETGLYAMLAQIIRLAIRDAHQTRNYPLCQEARAWLWEIAPYIANKADVPRPEGEAVTISIDALMWVAQLPSYAELEINEAGRVEVRRGYKALTVAELRGVLLKYRDGDRMAVKRFPSGSWLIEIARPVTEAGLREGVKLD